MLLWRAVVACFCCVLLLCVPSVYAGVTCDPLSIVVNEEWCVQVCGADNAPDWCSSYCACEFTDCVQGYVEDCYGNCSPESWSHDDICDKYNPNFNCPQFNFDNGACNTSCPPDTIRDVNGYCCAPDELATSTPPCCDITPAESISQGCPQCGLYCSAQALHDRYGLFQNPTTFFLYSQATSATDEETVVNRDPPEEEHENHEPGCCQPAPAELYYVDGGNVMRVEVDPQTYMPTKEPVVCAEFLNPRDIAIDSKKNIIVADSSAGEVYRIAPGCTAVQTLLSWHNDQFVDHPTAVAFVGGRVYVAGNSNSVSLGVSRHFAITSIEDPDLSVNHVRSIAEDGNGNVYFVEQGTRIMRQDGESGGVELWLEASTLNIPDFGAVKVTPCGVYFTSWDGHQIWRCDDPETCEMLCGEDEYDRCPDLYEPRGFTVDCQCNTLVAAQAGGTIRLTKPGELGSTEILSGLSHPTDVELYIPNTCVP